MNVMKRALPVFAALLLIGPGLALAQDDIHRFELGGFVGYQMGGRFESLAGRINLKDSMNYGFTFDLTLRRGGQFEFSYTRQDTDVSLDPVDGPPAGLFAAAVEYFQFGGLYERNLGRARPYGLASIGWMHVNPKATDIGSDSAFAAAVGGGVKIFPSKRVGFRLQARLLIPFLASGAGWFVGPGGGYVVAHGTTMVQFDLSAGLILGF
jgi:opacity protein-like surface antigen